MHAHKMGGVWGENDAADDELCTKPFQIESVGTIRVRHTTKGILFLSSSPSLLSSWSREKRRRGADTLTHTQRCFFLLRRAAEATFLY